MQVPQGRWSPGRCWRSACEDTFEGDEYVASAGPGVSGWGENNFDGLVHDLPNSLVDGATGNVLGDMDIVGAAARRGENDVRGDSSQFENSVHVRLAEPGCMNSFDGNSLNSLTCHPSMRAPSLARVFDGESGRVSRMFCRQGVGRGLRGRDTARLDASLHDVIRSVPACCYPEFKGSRVL